MATFYFLPSTSYFLAVAVFAAGTQQTPFPRIIAAKVQIFSFPFSIFPFSVLHEFRRFRAVGRYHLHEVDAGG